ncbi:hypothetical protein GCM10025868_08980 [Angustibacter aerolatus]|uniref:VOC domain-containing protein n=1 Tax=Angustibacter aerolatus TaxID=1162965 RepID=A0ABQ6JBW3_9ACTN|nr:hypothetical protein GCM10025868_08980 [Angustibacter aerolatus]
MSDVFGSLVKQHLLGQSAASADWLIGEGLFTDAVQGVALRSMKAPGTAYDDPTLGKDPQPASMADLVDTSDDNGGVHINSGIPNRAFYLAATAIGGNAWEGAGAVWYDTLTGGSLEPDADFATFAAATVTAATARFGEGSPQAAAVADAWAQVGVLSSSRLGRRRAAHHERSRRSGRVGGTPQARPRRPHGAGAPVWRVHRRAARARGAARRACPTPRRSAGCRCSARASLLDLAAASGEPAPDRYVYQVVSPQPGLLDAGTGLDVRAGEQQPARRRPVAARRHAAGAVMPAAVLDHVGLQCADYPASQRFYDAVLGELGLTRLMDVGVACGYGADHPVFWIGLHETGTGFRESHLAFAAADRAAVDAFVAAAVAHGGEVLHEPRVRPEYHEHYYGGFVRDPDGNNVEAVCHRPG